ncbi:hypothetical protein PSI22_13705 [Xenorhabdus sp. XENO-7]|uniref:Inclusion body protein n=1 Tax=Xenorhabdus aichiensis TaxID=3025874 RepID=A0ABT5M6R4_9GAMM|nr:hypothetical protein [Xenorhabdus aichiensis]MDC9622660.1 hypothetical protein [Xenorhabdus aichiensis]
MSNNFNLFVALDFDKIMAKNAFSVSKEVPKKIESSMIHMLFFDEKENKLLDKGGEVLTLDNVVRGDSIYWSLIKLPSYKSYYTAVITKYSKTGNNDQFISSPRLNVGTITIPYIINDDTKVIDTAKIKNNYWSSDVRFDKDVKVQTYKGNITLYDSDGNDFGYSYFEHKLILSTNNENS